MNPNLNILKWTLPLFVFFLVIFSIVCPIDHFHQEVITIHPSGNYTDHDLTCLESAVSTWNSVSPSTKILISASDHTPAHININFCRKEQINASERAPNLFYTFPDDVTIGTTYLWPIPRHADIWIEENMCTSIRESTILHEIGHAMGLPHFTNNTDVMYVTVMGNPTRFTHEEREYIEELYGGMSNETNI